MFIPKPVLAILFIVSLVSTGWLLYLLSQRTFNNASQPSATTTVIVSSSTAPSPRVSPTATASAALSASAEWKSISSRTVNVKIDYPSNWVPSASDSAILTISPTQSTQPLISVSRAKKDKLTLKVADYAKNRAEDYQQKEYTLKENTSSTVDDYPAVTRIYQKGNSSIKEIVFATKNYFYIITIDPAQSEYTAVVEELLKSVTVI